MSKKPKGIQIPIPVIVLCFVFGAWPVGVALALLRCFSFGGSSSAKSVQAEAGSETYVSGRNATVVQEASKQKQKKKEKKKKSSSQTLRIISIVLLSVALICGVSTISDLLSYGYLDHDMIFTSLYMLIGGGVTWFSGNIMKRRERDTVRYRALIGDRDSFNLAKLASATSYKIGRVRRDLQRLIDAGEFGDLAYIDMSNLCFMRTPDALPDGVEQQFDAYSRTMSSVGADLNKAAPKTETAQAGNTEDAPIDMQDFDAILKKIRRLDDEILDEPVSERIRKIESITRNIFEYVQDKPEKRKQIRMFMNYYLPTTLKLLESYSRIERVGVAGQNMQDAKDNIEKILDMLVVGFEQQFDQLFRAESMDITSDIEVLEQMMRKDGLSENNDFTLNPDAESILNSFTVDFSDDLSDETGGTAAAEFFKEQ